MRPVALFGLIAVPVATVLLLPNVMLAFSLTGDSLGAGGGGSGTGYQRDLRVLNNSVDASANDNQIADPAFPGALGAPLAVWKGAHAWVSDEPAAGQNFDFDWQGVVAAPAGADANVVQWVSGTACTGGILGFTLLPSSNGWSLSLCDNWTWSDGPEAPLAGQIDIQAIVAHELGHVLGLGHTSAGCNSCPDAPTMCAFANCGSVEARSIEPDDAAGVQAIYGAIPSNKPRITGVLGGAAGALIVRGEQFPAVAAVKFTAGSSVDLAPIPGTLLNVPTNGSELQIQIPAAAQSGNLLVWDLTHGLLSNAFPLDLNGMSPQILAVVPASVPAVGGTTLTITGSHLLGAGGVHIGNAELTPGQFTVIDDQTIVLDAPPAGALGPIGLTVSTFAGTSNPGAFVYQATDPPQLLGPPTAANGEALTLAYGGDPGYAAFLAANGDGQSFLFHGMTLLTPNLLAPLPDLDAQVGTGQLVATPLGVPPGAMVRLQIWTLDPPATSTATLKASNVITVAF